LGRGHRRRRCGVTTSTPFLSRAIATPVRQVDGALRPVRPAIRAVALHIDPGYFIVEGIQARADDPLGVSYKVWINEDDRLCHVFPRVFCR